MDADQLILDYVAVCERRGHLLDFSDFVELWKIANDIAEDTALDREATLAGILPDPE